MTTEPSPDDALDLVLRNSPISDRYTIGCFVDRLFEDAHFDAAGCVQLEGALLVLIDTPALAARADRHVFAIYRLVAIQLLCHLNPNDASVANLDDDAVIDLENHFDFVVGSYYCRQHFELGARWQLWRAERRGVQVTCGRERSAVQVWQRAMMFTSACVHYRETIHETHVDPDSVAIREAWQRRRTGARPAGRRLQQARTLGTCGMTVCQERRNGDACAMDVCVRCLRSCISGERSRARAGRDGRTCGCPRCV